jgi:Cd2+/Zn2+-exporting ATPase
MEKYRANEVDIMENREQIRADERRAFGHFHNSEGSAEEDCDLCGKPLDSCHCDFLGNTYKETVFHLENVDCMECAAKMEGKIREMPSVFFAALSFTTKELYVISKEDPETLLQEILPVCRSVDESAGIIPPADKSDYKTENYEIPTLDCAACALKLEKLINHQPGVLSASISYATKTMRLTAKDPDSLIPMLTEKCNEVESPTEIHKKVRPPKRKAAAPEKKESFFDKLKDEKGQLIIGGILFVIGMILHYNPGDMFNLGEMAGNIFFFISYLILGGPIVWAALKNITHGEFFDETFLMTIATLGAFGIQEYPEAVGVMFFYRIGEYFQDLAAGRSRKQIMDAVDLRPEVVLRVNGSETETIPAEEARVGDILLLRPGDRIPLDGIITEGTTQIDTSALTGEPKPVSAETGSAIDSGCVNMTGTIKMQVTKILAESMVTRILDSVENAVASKPKIDRFITRFSRIYTPLVVLVALIVAFVPPLLFGGDWEKSIYTALTFLVISCPCALVISVPLAFFAGIGTASKEGILFKGGTIIETLSKIKAAVMDKTGTITEGKFKVREVLPASGVKEEELIALAAGAEIYSTHPIAKSIVEEAGERNLTVPTLEDLHEEAGHGVIGKLEGNTIYAGNDRLMKKAGISEDKLPQSQGTGTLVYVARNQEFLGCIVIADALKSDAIHSIRELKEIGVTPVMLTGDNKNNAEAIAEKAGIKDVYAQLLPQDKLSIMKEIRESKGAVLFVGDGINDAPVLAGADAGAAMGSGADAAIEAADIVFLNSDVQAIPKAIRLSRKVIRTAWENVGFALFVKIAVMVMGLAGFANMWVAVFADTGVTLLCILYSIRLLKIKI